MILSYDEFLRLFVNFIIKFSFCISDEQERVQKKTFVNWINSYLSKVRLTSFHVRTVLMPLRGYLFMNVNFDKNTNISSIAHTTFTG